MFLILAEVSAKISFLGGSTGFQWLRWIHKNVAGASSESSGSIYVHRLDPPGTVEHPLEWMSCFSGVSTGSSGYPLDIVDPVEPLHIVDPSHPLRWIHYIQWIHPSVFTGSTGSTRSIQLHPVNPVDIHLIEPTGTTGYTYHYTASTIYGGYPLDPVDTLVKQDIHSSGCSTR